jgi:hypothetical protein
MSSFVSVPLLSTYFKTLFFRFSVTGFEAQSIATPFGEVGKYPSGGVYDKNAENIKM